MEVSSSNHTKAPAFEGISRYKALMAVLNLTASGRMVDVST